LTVAVHRTDYFDVEKFHCHMFRLGYKESSLGFRLGYKEPSSGWQGTKENLSCRPACKSDDDFLY